MIMGISDGNNLDSFRISFESESDSNKSDVKKKIRFYHFIKDRLYIKLIFDEKGSYELLTKF